MTKAELRRAVKHAQITANIVSDGSRCYFVELLGPEGMNILQDRHGKILFFYNIGEARALLAKAKVTTIALTMRIAADEACAGPLTQNSGFATLPINDG